MSRTSSSIKNMNTAVFIQFMQLLLGFLSRKVFVVILSAEYLGLNGLFSNVLSMLSLMELGVGSAIIFSMYKPLAENDVEKIKTLMALYKKAYITIGILVGVIGCAITPLLPLIVGELPQISGIYGIYLLFVLNTASSYFFSYKRSIIIADQKRYIDTCNHFLFVFLYTILQIIALILTHNYILYLCIQILCTFLENIRISRKANQLYPYLKDKYSLPLEPADKRAIQRNVGAMLLHKIGGVVVTGTDNLLIAHFIGLVMVGVYSNYVLITSAIKSFTALIYTSITASIGSLNTEAETAHKQEVFHQIFFLSAWVFGFCSISLLCLMNPFVELYFGSKYLLSMPITCIVVLNFYISGLRQPVLTTRDAMGLFWYDRYKPLFESVINLVVSIVLAQKFGLAGVLLGTLVSTMTTCFWVEPYVLYRHGLGASLTDYFKRYGIYTAVTAVAMTATWGLCSLLPQTGILAFLEKTMVCLIVPNLIYLVCFGTTKEFKYFNDLIKALIRRRR